jgi:ABC-2 type transport system permease protein
VGAPLPLHLLTSVDHQLAGDVARSIADSFVAQVNADRLSVATALAAGAPVDRIDALVASAAGLRLPTETTQQPTGARQLKPVSYFGPAMGIFFVFFAISFGARGYFIEKREGTLERMSAAVHPGAVLVGKALSVFVYGVLSLATMAVFTTVAFGADWGGPLPAAALIVSMVISVVVLTMFVTVIARTERQAEGFSSIVVFALALLGGNFVFVSAAPELLRRLALFTPNGWALRGFVDLATSSHSLTTIGQPVLAIFAFTAVVGAVTAVLFRRVVIQ